MCGIVGIISKRKTGLFHNDINILEEMLWVDQLRGKDGTGIFWDTKKGANSLKMVGTPISLFSNKSYKNLREEIIQQGHFVIGHNRAATKGSHSYNNTHPFVQGHIVGVHNGTLIEHKHSLAETESDSKAIFVHMEQNGYVETLKTIHGPFALSWYDCNDKSLNFARNDGRPLSILECDACWIVSSESGLGSWMAERNNLKVIKIHFLQPKKLYTIFMSDVNNLVISDVEHRVVSPVDYNKYSPPEYTPSLPSPPPKSYHGWGTRIRFIPTIKIAENLERGIFLDDNRGQWFLSGREEGQTSSYIKVFGTYPELEKLEKENLLEGTVTSTKIRQSKSVLYEVVDVKPIVVEEKKIITPKTGVWGKPCKCLFCQEELDAKQKQNAVFDQEAKSWICEFCFNQYGNYLVN